ncbi:MAG: MerP protein [Lentimicrobium sp.]|nr:MerP protein [Lentimicrobium sp.]
MKRIKIGMLVILVSLIGRSLSAQDAKTAEIEILTSAQCSMCKETIEKAMAFEKGVIKAELVVDTKILMVTYKPAKTSPEVIRKAVSAVGYDADEVAANPEVYEKLADCCKKPEDRKSDHSGHNH